MKNIITRLVATREAMLLFELEAELLTFTYQRPALAPLFQLAVVFRPQRA